MWKRFKEWLCSKQDTTIVTKTVVSDMETDVLSAIVKYVQGDVDMKVIKRINELTSVAAMRNSGRLDPIQIDAIEKALVAWCKKEPTPQEFVNLFRGGR